MDKTVVICFSQEKESLDLLFYELDDYFGNSVNQTGFKDKFAFIESLISNGTEKVELIIIEVYNAEEDTIDLINTLNEITPNSVKLLIGKNQHLLNIQLRVLDDQSLHYLTQPWTKTDLLLALNSSTAHRSYINSAFELDDKELLIKARVEKEISMRLKELIESNYAKDKFLSIIAHDLKSPFLGLLGITDILLKDWNELEENSKLELIEDIRKSSEETYKLLEDLLAWAKSQREKLEISINEIKVHNIIDSSIKVSENNAIPKGVKVQNNIKNNLKVKADERMIATVFRNLISNAVKFTNPGGKIKITAKEEKNYCTFCVSDDGSGIYKKDILEFFNHKNLNGLNDGKKKNKAIVYNNKGLGLILCKDFVERNGGRIWLETREGEGSKFYFTVPC